MSPTPSQAYLVCATPRSGSTLLCETLRATRIAGHPSEHFEILRHSNQPRQPREYFTGVEDPAVLDLLAPLDAVAASPAAAPAEPAGAWWERIVRDGSSDNGVWGGKLMWGHVSDFVARARGLDGLAGADLDRVVRALLGPRTLFVFVTRRDRVSQAVSLWRAVQTQSWRKDGGRDAADAQYRFAGIDHLARQLDAHEAAWRRWFADHDVEPLEVVYEQLSEDLEGGVQRVLRALDLPPVEVPPAPLSPQRDGRSQEWADRYRDELKAAA